VGMTRARPMDSVRGTETVQDDTPNIPLRNSGGGYSGGYSSCMMKSCNTNSDCESCLNTTCKTVPIMGRMCK
jgi:hypothetical protein